MRHTTSFDLLPLRTIYTCNRFLAPKVAVRTTAHGYTLHSIRPTHQRLSAAASGAALLAHQVRKPKPLKKLKPVHPAIARRQVAEIFQHPELRQARKPEPWIHPDHNVAYMGDSVVLLQEPSQDATLRHPQIQCCGTDAEASTAQHGHSRFLFNLQKLDVKMQKSSSNQSCGTHGSPRHGYTLSTTLPAWATQSFCSKNPDAIPRRPQFQCRSVP